MIQVYLCAPFREQDRARAIANVLRLNKIAICSRWITSTEADTPESWEKCAQGDLDDVRKAHILMAINPESWREKGTGGRHVEFGYALAMQIPILLYGERTNAFHYLAQVEHLSDPGDFVKAINKLYESFYEESQRDERTSDR